MSPKNEKAKKAAATRAKNKQQQTEADQTLLESTRHPWSAKIKALEDAVWMATPSRQKRPASPSQERMQEKRPRTTPAEKESAEDPSPTKKSKSKSKSLAEKKSSTSTTLAITRRKQAPKAAQIDSDTSDNEEEASVPQRVTITSDHRKHDSDNDPSDSEGSCSEDLDTVNGQTTSGSDSESDDLLDVGEKALSRMLAAEQPTMVEPTPNRRMQDHNTIDNIDLSDVEQSHQRRTRSISAHRSGAQPGASDDEEQKPKAKKARVYRPSGRRAKAFALEEPRIDEEPSKASPGHRKRASMKASVQASLDWPKHAKLVLPASGSGLQLTNQHVLIVDVVKTAIANMTAQVLLDDSFPETDKKFQYRRNIIRHAARERKEEVPPINDIYTRLKQDIEFSDNLGNLVLDRIATVQGPAKASAITQIVVYELGTGSKCIDRVDALFQQEAFIFPGSWTTNPKTGKPLWSTQGSQPFLNQAIVEILRSAFFQHQPTSSGYQMLAKYPLKFASSLSSGCSKREMPMAMAALGGTAAYAAIFEWKTGSRQKFKFEGNIFASIYITLYKTLERLKVESLAFFHHIMSMLYKLVIGAPAVELKGDGALQLIDLSGFN